MGIHVGPAIVGEMGYAEAVSVTAVGDTVNTASRLESMSKEFAAQLVVSSDVAVQAGADLSAWRREAVRVRGRREPLALHVVVDAGGLPPPTASASSSAAAPSPRLRASAGKQSTAAWAGGPGVCAAEPFRIAGRDATRIGRGAGDPLSARKVRWSADVDP